MTHEELARCKAAYFAMLDDYGVLEESKEIYWALNGGQFKQGFEAALKPSLGIKWWGVSGGVQYAEMNDGRIVHSIDGVTWSCGVVELEIRTCLNVC